MIILKRFSTPYITRKMKVGVGKIKRHKLSDVEKATRKAMELVKTNKYL